MGEKKISKLAKSVIDSVNNKVSASLLTQVVNDWQIQFQELKRYKASQKILKRIGPVVMGIELEKFLSDEYRPRIIMYNLVDDTNNLVRIIDQTLKNQKGLEVSIKYSQHSQAYLEACELLKQQSRIDLNGKSGLEEILKGIILYIEKDCIGNSFWSCQAIMQLSNLLGDENRKELYFNRGFSLLNSKLPAQLIEMQTKGADKWAKDIKNLSLETINKRIEENLKEHKLEEVPEIK